MQAARTDHSILHTACLRTSLDDHAATPLHRHATSIYLLPRHKLVARISRSPGAGSQAATGVAIARWLTGHDFPATTPAAVDQPVDVEDASVTFWHYYPQPDGPGPGAAALGHLLRRLHTLPHPPVSLTDYVPLTNLGDALDLARHTENAEGLTPSELRWLTEHRLRLLDAYQGLRSELGTGFIHGDAYPGNTLWADTARDRVLLGDWDEVAHGPRELDLVNTHHGARTGRSPAERQAFTDTYGWDVTTWPGYPVLRDLRDLHTLGAYLRRALAGDRAAAGELHHRVHTLRTGDRSARWHPC